MRHTGIVIVLGIVVGLSACVSFRPFSARIAGEVQSLYRAAWRFDPDADYLFIALDGVPYTLATELQEQGYFPSFHPASELITTFPSSTMTGFTGLFRPLGCEIPQGYENKFFSLSENRYRGHTWRDYRNILVPFHLFFNYYRHSIFNKASMYAAPARTVRHDLAKIKRRLLQAKGPHMDMVYIGGTDGAAHVLGRYRTALLLKTVSRRLEKLRAAYLKHHGKVLHLVLFSDHGFHFTKLRSIVTPEIKAALKKYHYRLKKSIRTERDVVPVFFGNLSSGIFYTRETQAQGVARALADLNGIDLVFYKHGPHSIGVYSRNIEHALITVAQDGRELCYLATRGNPLNYPEACLGREEWWRLSRDHPYPNAINRLYDAFYVLVHNKAQVMVSTLPDFEIGSSAARIGGHIHGGLEGTHGGLFRSASAAFVMTTLPITLPKILSYDELFPQFMSVQK